MCGSAPWDSHQNHRIQRGACQNNLTPRVSLCISQAFVGGDTGGSVGAVAQGTLGRHIDRPWLQRQNWTPALQTHDRAAFSKTEATKHSGERILIDTIIKTFLAPIDDGIYCGATYEGGMDGRTGHISWSTHIYRVIRNHIPSHGIIGRRINILCNPVQSIYFFRIIGK